MSYQGRVVHKIAALTAAATGAQAAFLFQLGPDVGCTLQVQFSGTGSVTLEGRLSPDAPWVTLNASITEATDGAMVAVVRGAPEMRANVTANSANVDVWLMA